MAISPQDAKRATYALVLILFFASGFSALVYQVVWVQMLDKVFGVTTFAASAVLGAYFAGLGRSIGGKQRRCTEHSERRYSSAYRGTVGSGGGADRRSPASLADLLDGRLARCRTPQPYGDI